MYRPTPDEVQEKQRLHELWLKDPSQGERANFSGFDLRGMDLQRYNFRCANFMRTNLQGADLRGAIFQYADLQGAILSNADLEDAILQDANLHGASLRGAILQHAILQGADLQGANLQCANLQDAIFQGADIQGANLQHAVLRGAILQHADLQGADLQGAILQGANLQHAILQGADLRGAILRGANLQHADIQGAELQDAILQDAIGNYSTVGIHPAPEGDLIGWGKKNGHIVKLLIPAEAKRSCATTRKHRAEFAKVLEIEGTDEVVVENEHATTVYKVGEIVRCHKWDDDRWNECGGGIHFFLTREEAEAW